METAAAAVVVVEAEVDSVVIEVVVHSEDEAVETFAEAAPEAVVVADRFLSRSLRESQSFSDDISSC